MAEKIKLSFKDNSECEFPKGVKAEEVVKQRFGKKAGMALAVVINKRVVDLSAPINESGEFDILTFEDEAGMDLFRHSSSHLMALAVKRLYPNAKFAIGPSIEDGFYYDFDNLSISDKDLKKIEAEIKKIIHEKLPFIRREISKQEALKLFKNEPYKLELINDLPASERITTYKLGAFEDLCRGPHVPHSGVIGAVKLLKVAGAYWRGDSTKKMLTRIYGTSFPDKKMLSEYLTRLEEAKKRDHRKLGQEMDLFSFHDEARGFPFWHPKGMILWDEIINYWKEVHRKYGYGEVRTPIILNKDLWLRSGHWEHYKENMYFTTIDDVEHAVKPMNCPGGILIYKSRLHSYKEFPLKLAELGLVHRHELSGVLHGLARVRSFTQDDAHVYCLPDQLEQEIINIIDLVYELYGAFGLKDYRIELSTKPDKHIGSEEDWRRAEEALEKALKKKNAKYDINPGEGAFYGPKIDFHIRDSIGRSWQCGTIQVDFAMPERFDLTYEGRDGRKHRPVMIHRAILGSIERFVGILLEHYAGKLPLWLNPVQVKLLPIADRHAEYARRVAEKMKSRGIRVEVDERSESTSKKVRDAQLEKVNYILVVGDKEEEAGTVNVRTRDNEVKGPRKVEEFIDELLKEIKEKRIK
ncbi:MAG TPA: threonine--tRNA ligase [Candidatus Woesearchaeota archaeon]|nr:threonine--tRNA ligase [Candidatus Woesearchaeota archaeon]